jgi:hypothetical protein
MSHSIISRPASSSTLVLDFPTDIAQLGLPVNSYLPHAVGLSNYTDIRHEAVSLQAALRNTNNDLKHIRNEHSHMVESNQQLYSQMKNVELGMHTLMHRVASVTAKFRSCALHTTKNECEFSAIENELEETKKEMISAKVDLPDAQLRVKHNATRDPKNSMMASEGIRTLNKERTLKSSSRHLPPASCANPIRTKFSSRAQVTVKAKVCPVSPAFCPQ